MVTFGFSEISSPQRSVCLCVHEGGVGKRERCVERLDDIAWCLGHTPNLPVNIHKSTLLVGCLNSEARKDAFTLNRVVLWGSEPWLGMWGVTPAELQSSNADHCPKQLDPLTTYCSWRGWREGKPCL